MIFSMAELSLASCNESVLIKILSFGMLRAAPFISANALRAAAVFFMMALVSKSKSKGSCGILYAISFFFKLPETYLQTAVSRCLVLWFDCLAVRLVQLV